MVGLIYQYIIIENNDVSTCVSDDGTGIDPAIMPRLFSKFASQSETDTGLGLFISKKYCGST